jgi:DNA invertase Pin-like site-specific DNA recombinase
MNSITPIAEFNPDGRRIALYLRSACVSQNDPSAALDPQRRVLLDLVAWHQLELIAEYGDAPASGLDPERPGLRRLLDDAKAECRTFDIVFVESLSRLSRQVHEIVEIARELAKRGIQLYCAEQGCIITAAAFSGFAGKGR